MRSMVLKQQALTKKGYYQIPIHNARPSGYVAGECIRCDGKHPLRVVTSVYDCHFRRMKQSIIHSLHVLVINESYKG